MEFEENVNDFLEVRIRILSQLVWEWKADLPDLEMWLKNFDGQVVDIEVEQKNALHLLAHFNYFGLREIRVLLRALYRDLFRYPIIQAIRDRNCGTKDISLIHGEFDVELAATRFLGMGNPSESGSHLLYYFRQENELTKSLFIHQHEILRESTEEGVEEIAIENLKRLVFIDDILGSGNQALKYSDRLLKRIKKASENMGCEIEIDYYVLFAKPEGLIKVRSDDCLFDNVNAVHEMDASESAFDTNSRVYSDIKTPVTKDLGIQIARHYGSKLLSSDPLGYGDGQLLLGLHHNVPNNTLPIFWSDDIAVDWNPVFPRYRKVD